MARYNWKGGSRASQQRYRDKNPDRVRAWRRAWYQRHKQKQLDKARAKHSKREYDLPREQYDAMVLAQAGLCYLCGKVPKIARKRTTGLEIDHDHETGVVRKLLCRHCNLLLGHLENNAALVDKALAYIQEHKRCR